MFVFASSFFKKNFIYKKPDDHRLSTPEMIPIKKYS